MCSRMKHVLKQVLWVLILPNACLWYCFTQQFHIYALLNFYIFHVEKLQLKSLKWAITSTLWELSDGNTSLEMLGLSIYLK